MAEGKETLLKFPRTPHIYDLGGSAVTRDDLLLDARDAEALLRTALTLEEKLDGANLGISITADYRVLCQNRSHYVNGETHSQFKRLPQWLAEHQGELFEALEPERHILFGEWLYARHSVPYSRLPDYFLAFDIYDRHAGHFLSRKERARRLEGTSIHQVPVLFEGVVGSKEELVRFLERTSAFGEGFVEGVYLRRDSDCDADAPPAGDGGSGDRTAEAGRLVARAKLVRPDFLQNITTHWSKRTLEKNGVRFAT